MAGVWEGASPAGFAFVSGLSTHTTASHLTEGSDNSTTRRSNTMKNPCPASMIIDESKRGCFSVWYLIDPTKKPIGKSLVLVGNRLEPWNGQSSIQGVAIRFGSEKA
jgi:hypothetical protein